TLGARSVCHQDRVGLALLIQILLELRERHEHRADVALLRLERELAKPGAARREPDGSPNVFLAAVQRLERNRPRFPQPKQDGAARRGAQLPPQRIAQQALTAAGRLARLRLEPPEALIHPVNLHTGYPPSARLVHHDSVDRDHWAGRAKLRGQPLAEEAIT